MNPVLLPLLSRTGQEAAEAQSLSRAPTVRVCVCVCVRVCGLVGAYVWSTKLAFYVLRKLTQGG